MAGSKVFKYHASNPYIYNCIPKNAKILDIGCATGRLGEKIKQEKHPKFLAGIEIDSERAKIAKKFYDKVLVIDLNDLNKLEKLPLKRNYFDVVVCVDVLGYLRDPLKTLKNLIPYLSGRGFFLFSVPNIAFIQIRFLLLFGRFEYNPRGGILDEEYVHFFTYKSFLDLLKNANLDVIFIRGYNLVKPKFFFLKFLGRLFPTLFSIQFLAKARKSI